MNPSAVDAPPLQLVLHCSAPCLAIPPLLWSNKDLLMTINFQCLHDNQQYDCLSIQFQIKGVKDNWDASRAYLQTQMACNSARWGINQIDTQWKAFWLLAKFFSPATNSQVYSLKSCNYNCWVGGVKTSSTQKNYDDIKKEEKYDGLCLRLQSEG